VKNKLIGILLILIMLIVIVPSNVLADYGGINTNISIGNTAASRSSIVITQKILGTLQVAGSIISVVALIIIGIRYMCSSLEEKAQMKGVMTYYIIGAVLVFATSNILGMAYSTIEGINPYHSWSIVRKEATCTTAGSITRTCTKCKKVIVDTIAAKGHNYGSWTTKAATCTTAGNKTRTCSRCKTSETETIAATGHSYGSWTTTKDATCTTAGNKTRTCSTCKNSETQTITKLGHIYEWTTTKEATCTANGSKRGTCSTCKTTKIEIITKLGHNYGSWTTTKYATCTTAGNKTKTCSRCANKETQTIAATGHVYNSSWTTTKAATCTVAGSKERRCVKCSTVVKEAIAATGHNYEHKNYPKPAALKGTKTHYERSVCSKCSDERLTKEDCDLNFWGTCKKCCQNKNQCD